MKASITDGVALEYDEYGSGDPVVFIHGALVADLFQPLTDVLKRDSSYRLLTYHRRGYAGSSRVLNGISVAQQAGDCRELLRTLGYERVHVVGHSFGGTFALQLAIDEPDIVSSLVLMEPALLIGDSAARYRASLEAGATRFHTDGAEAFVDSFLEARCPGYRIKLDAMIPGAFSQAVADAQTTLVGDLPGIIDWQVDKAEVAVVRTPTLSVIGDGSEALWSRFGESHRWLLATLPNVEELIISNATHFTQLDNPEQLANGLIDFWTRWPINASAANVS